MFHVKHGQDHRLLYTSQKALPESRREPTGIRRLALVCYLLLYLVLLDLSSLYYV